MFVEHDVQNLIWKKKIPGDGVVTGYGTINGRLLFSAKISQFLEDHCLNHTQKDFKDHG